MFHCTALLYTTCLVELINPLLSNCSGWSHEEKTQLLLADVLSENPRKIARFSAIAFTILHFTHTRTHTLYNLTNILEADYTHPGKRLISNYLPIFSNCICFPFLFLAYFTFLFIMFTF